MRRWLRDEHGFSYRRSAAQLASVVGAHHRVPSTSADVGLVQGRPDLAGVGLWVAAQESALRWAAEVVDGPEVLRSYAGVALGRPFQALLAGIVIMTDWIASNAELFPLDDLHTAHELPREPDPHHSARRLKRGWANLDLPSRWRPQLVPDPRSAFAARFGREPRPVQMAAVEAAAAQDQSGMVIVEAPMG